MRLKIASRKSDLARWQAVQVAHALEKIAEKPGIEFIFKSSFGDQNLDIPLAGMGQRGVFTEDFLDDLVKGRCDLVVHSWKDLPVEERADTIIAMTLPRADVRDIILIPEEVWQEALAEKRLRVLTSSPRRVYNLGKVLSQLLPGQLKIEFVNVRGNVPTRMRKMREEGAALVLAKAGLDRLLQADKEGFLAQAESVRELARDCRFQVFPVSLNPPAPAQGALAIEITRENETMAQICARLTDDITTSCVREERQVLSRYGGGCHQKIGVARLPREYGIVRALCGLTDDGKELHEWSIQNNTPWNKASSRAKVFPLNAKENSWFDRESIPANERLGNQSAIFVARADAWPGDFKPASDQVVWTAGVQTWLKLAAQGIFVNGTQDGLGEREEKGTDLLCGALTWCKLSHEGAPHSEGKVLATYRLKPKVNVPDLRGKTHFFWMSRTSFERARELYPIEIQNGHHACGPGNTYEFLRTQKFASGPVKVFIGLEQFLHETLP